MRRTTRFAAGALAAALVLSACGGGGDDDNNDSGGGSFEEGGDFGGTTDPEREGPREIEGAEEGGIVKVVSFTALEDIDPRSIYYVHTNAIMAGLVTRSLTQFVVEDGEAVLVPDIATDLGTPNEDFTEWTFEIREGVKFEDGTEVTAEDIKRGMEMSMDIATFPESPGAYSLEYYEGAEDFQGTYTGKGETLDSIVADGNTLTIRMSKPFPDMPYWASFPANGPIPEGDVSNPDRYRQRPIATGPYKIETHVPRERLVLVRNEQWDPATDPGRTAYPDGYDMDFTVPNEQIDELILNDQGDAQNTMTFDDILGENYRTFLAEAEDRVVNGTTPCTRYWAMDYRKITDKKVREALAYAYPYSAAIKAAGLIEGVTRVPGTNLMPPGTVGREEFNVLDKEPGETLPEKSKELLAEAGAEGYEIKFLFAQDDPLAVAAKDAIVKGLEQGGFKATPVPTTTENITTDRENPDADINVRAAGWCSDWPTGSSWFPPLLRTENLEQLGQISQNYSVFSEPEVDARMAEILELPLEEQPAAWNEMDQQIQEDYLPLFVTSYDGVAWAHGSKVMGGSNDPTLGMPSFRNIWLDQE